LDTTLEDAELLVSELVGRQQKRRQIHLLRDLHQFCRKPQKTNPQLVITSFVYDFRFANCKFI